MMEMSFRMLDKEGERDEDDDNDREMLEKGKNVEDQSDVRCWGRRCRGLMMLNAGEGDEEGQDAGEILKREREKVRVIQRCWGDKEGKNDVCGCWKRSWREFRVL